MATSERRRNLYKKQDGKCYYCYRHMTMDDDGPMSCTTDHKVPRSHGGRSIAANLVGACKQCNGLKKDMTVEQFRKFMETDGYLDLIRGIVGTRKERREQRKEYIKKVTAGGLEKRKEKMKNPEMVLSRVYCVSVESVFADVLERVRAQAMAQITEDPTMIENTIDPDQGVAT